RQRILHHFHHDAVAGNVRFVPVKFILRPPHAVTNGAFKLVAWDFKRQLRLEKNEFYWDKAHVPSNSIVMEVVEDPLTQILRYDSGGVDWLAAVPSEV